MCAIRVLCVGVLWRGRPGDNGEMLAGVYGSVGGDGMGGVELTLCVTQQSAKQSNGHGGT